MEPIKTIQDLIESYQKLPGVGYKTAERLAYATLELSPEERSAFMAALNDCNVKVQRCPDCGTYFDDVCPICSDPKRDKTVVMVVSESKDILSIEKTNGFPRWLFHAERDAFPSSEPQSRRDRNPCPAGSGKTGSGQRADLSSPDRS